MRKMNPLKTNKKSKAEKAKEKKRRKAIIIYIAIVLFSIPIYIVLLNLVSATELYSDKNTISIVGTVTNIDEYREPTGYKSRHFTRIRIELDNTRSYYVNSSILKDNGYDKTKLENAILNEDIEIRCSKIDNEKIASLSMGETNILTYGDFNEIARHNRIGMLMVYVFVLIGVAIFVFL